MSRKSDDFEKQITRIHKVLEKSNLEVTWNDRVPDPHNPSQRRQIDFTIKNPDSFVIGECRIHKAPQDVKWIEELIGRRTSLGADGIEAVSASGFTNGAVLKAKAFGVILRNFYEITESELETWGKTTQLKVNFAELTELTFSYKVQKRENLLELTQVGGAPIVWLPFLQQILHEILERSPKCNPSRFCLNVGVENFYAGSEQVKSLDISGFINTYKQKLDLMSVHCYGEVLNEPNAVSDAFVQKFDFAGTQVIGHVGNVRLIVDCSSIKIPSSSLFVGFEVGFGKVVHMDALEVVGVEYAFKGNMDISFDVRLK